MRNGNGGRGVVPPFNRPPPNLPALKNLNPPAEESVLHSKALDHPLQFLWRLLDELSIVHKISGPPLKHTQAVARGQTSEEETKCNSDVCDHFAASPFLLTAARK